MRSEIKSIIPCVTGHTALFDDGNEYKIIGWGSKENQTKKIEGDIEKVNEVSGMIVIEDKVLFADEVTGFKKYKNQSEIQTLNNKDSKLKIH